MEGKTLSGQFPVSGFQKLARLMDEENDVFQRHVLDLARDMIEDPDMHRSFKDSLGKQIPEKDIQEFLKSMPTEKGYQVRPGPVQDLLTLAETLKDSHVSQNDIALLIASELIHRRSWKKTMEENPETLQALKNKLGS
ncbi:MAG: hypothetical protein ACAH80_16335 [Alphaproteobacteria bacterium]